MDLLISEYLQECKFVSITDISLESTDAHMNLKDMMTFFDYILYNVCDYENNVLNVFHETENKVDTITSELVLRSQKIIKKISSKFVKSQGEYIYFYEKYKRYIQSIFDILYERDDGMFFISNVNDSENMICIFNYKSYWKRMIQNQNSFENFSDLEMILFLSGYIYIFQTKNIMGKHTFEGIRDNIIIVYYETPKE